MGLDLNQYLTNYMNKKSLFAQKKALQATYDPNTILHRDEQMKYIADVLAPVLRGEKPSNLFIYGKTGTGKTLVTRHVVNQIKQLSKSPLHVIYLNCKLKKVADTEYRLIAQLIREFGEEIPATGLPTDEVYKKFYSLLDNAPGLLLIILDEVDQLVKKAGDELLYNLTRINSELQHSQVSLLGISNDLLFADHIDPRVKSSLSEEELVFAPYNALQIKEILQSRSEIAFEKNIIVPGVIEKCAAYAAREHGDARRALELLRVAGELAEREGCEQIDIKHLDCAENKIEKDRLHDIVFTQPKQHQATLYSLLSIFVETSKKRNLIFTGEVYELYKNVCQQIGLTTLTQRRISDILAEMDMLGIIAAKVVSKGRYGRTREITLAIPDSSVPDVKRILEDGLNIR